MKTLENLPDHKVPENIQLLGIQSPLLIQGMVQNPHLILLPELALLTRLELEDDFTCLEGWNVQSLKWSGVRLSDVIKLGKPLPNAHFVLVHGQDDGYQVPFPLEETVSIFLCDRLNGGPIPLEHGAPWRLIKPGGTCFTSVKWVTSLELTTNPGINSGKDIALSRI